jgi:hypothetical protein
MIFSLRTFKLIHLAIMGPAMLTGPFLGWSTAQWISAAEQGQLDGQRAKRDLIGSAGLFKLHNEIYSKVGPKAWESEVKPDFMSAITWATVRDTGNLIPEAQDVVEWVRAHPDEARTMLKGVSRLGPEALR